MGAKRGSPGKSRKTKKGRRPQHAGQKMPPVVSVVRRLIELHGADAGKIFSALRRAGYKGECHHPDAIRISAAPGSPEKIVLRIFQSERGPSFVWRWAGGEAAEARPKEEDSNLKFY